MHKLIAAAFALLSIGLLTQCSWQNFEQREEYVYHGPGGKVRLNPYYASERLLVRLGLQTHSVRNLPEIGRLGPNDGVILNTPSYSLSQTAVAELLDWVNKGGILIFSPAQYPATDAKTEDHLLRALGVAIQKDRFSGTNTAIDFTESPSLTVRFRGNTGLLDSDGKAVWQASNSDKVQLLHYHIGDGAVTVLSDLSLFYNDSIGEYDHADFLWSLLHLDADPQAVWLQFVPQVPSLWELIWQYGWMVLKALVLLLIALAWAANQRLGPKLIEYRDTQRSLLEHIHAGGRFIWRHGAREALLNAARQRIRARWKRRRGEAASASGTELDFDALASQTGLDAKQIIAVFNGAHSGISAHEFTHAIKILQKIESTL